MAIDSEGETQDSREKRKSFFDIGEDEPNMNLHPVYLPRFCQQTARKLQPRNFAEASGTAPAKHQPPRIKEDFDCLNACRYLRVPAKTPINDETKGEVSPRERDKRT